MIKRINNSDNQAEGGQLGLLKDLQGALRSHPGEAGIVEEACGVVYTMCYLNSHNQAEGGCGASSVTSRGPCAATRGRPVLSWGPAGR